MTGVPGPVAFEAWLEERGPGVLGLTFSVINRASDQYRVNTGCAPAMGLKELQLIIDGIEVRPQEIAWPSENTRPGGRQILKQDGSGLNVATFAGKWTLEKDGQQQATGDRTDGWTDICGKMRAWVSPCVISLKSILSHWRWKSRTDNTPSKSASGRQAAPRSAGHRERG